MASGKRATTFGIWTWLKPAMDLALTFGAFGIAYWMRYDLQWFREVEPAFHVPFRVYLPSVCLLAALVVINYWIDGAYRSGHRGITDELTIIFRGTLTGIAAMIFVVFLATPSYYSRLIFAYAGAITVLLLAASRLIERSIIVNRLRKGVGATRVLMVGAGETARSLMRVVVARPELGYQIVGYVDDNPAKAESEIGRFPGLGATDAIPELIRQHEIDEVIITLPWHSHRKIVQIMRACERRQTRTRIVPDMFQITLSTVVVDNLDGIPLLGVQEPQLSAWQHVIKRVLDVSLSALGLLILSPLLGIISLAIRLDSPGPAIFRQERVGRGGETFTCFKFRSMVTNAEAKLDELADQNQASGPLFKIKEDPRQTNVGRWLRRTSIDELPQLANVLLGDMSLVGPRPAIPSEVEQYDPWHMRRIEVSPGITGMWQVGGRSDLSFDEMVLLDIYYIENWSPLLDLRILLKTIPTVLFRRGAY